jgi:DNA-binding PadR family transcriptional regulator
MKNSSLTLASAIILRAVSEGHCYGFEIMEATGLPSGTIYPALRRLQEARLIRSAYHETADSQSQGPPRKYFRTTAEGERALEAAGKRYPVVAARGG